MRVSTSLILPVFFSVLAVLAQEYGDDASGAVGGAPDAR